MQELVVLMIILEMTLAQTDHYQIAVDMPMRPRLNQDVGINDEGKLLTHLCQSHQMCILNGRTNGDSMGSYTYYGRNGCSTIDYCLVSECLIPCVEYFNVDAISHYSGHCQLSVGIRCSVHL
jgi:hypothetical protein